LEGTEESENKLKRIGFWRWWYDALCDRVSCSCKFSKRNSV